MGWRGTLRSIEAASRRAAREAEKQRKADQKALMIADAEMAVEEWSQHLEEIVSIHVDRARQIDWVALRDAPMPAAPKVDNANELHAQSKLDAFQPGFFDFLFGGSDRRLQRLNSALVDAQAIDSELNATAQSEHAQLVSDWETDKELAAKLLAGDIEAEREVIAEMSSWSETDLIGSSLSFRMTDEYLHAVAKVHGDEVVPSFRRKQLQSGKLSETNMPVGQRYELYQDYVCSVALKVAGDLLSVLPRPEVYITCAANMLDSTTGHMSYTPMLSVQVVRPAFDGLRLASIDPSDSMSNFNHEMNFRKTKGFLPVEPLKPLPDDQV